MSLRHTASAKPASLSPPRPVPPPAVFFFPSSSSSAPVHCHHPCSRRMHGRKSEAAKFCSSAFFFFFFFVFQNPRRPSPAWAHDERNKRVAFSFGPSQVCGFPSANNGLSRQLHGTALHTRADYAKVCASLPLRDSKVTEQQRQQTRLSIPGKARPALIACLYVRLSPACAKTNFNGFCFFLVGLTLFERIASWRLEPNVNINF